MERRVCKQIADKSDAGGDAESWQDRVPADVRAAGARLMEATRGMNGKQATRFLKAEQARLERLREETQFEIIRCGQLLREAESTPEREAYRAAEARLRARLSQPVPSEYGHYVSPQVVIEHGGREWTFDSSGLLRRLGAESRGGNYYGRLDA